MTEIEQEIERIKRNISILKVRIMNCRPQYILDYSNRINDAKAELKSLEAKVNPQSSMIKIHDFNIS